ncbi:60S acidic ribosomal protein P2 OS=Rhodotorula glutinis PE=1 SV=1 [Rhizoctonia solani AG-1 IB]|uniref:60S acidic ribosomal protein P2 n=1 Tax=Thanatephorus cucumeris (strain AG1-IB / isolate 7/3/14) TaxID=1108050 RepID=A0A0B7FZP7_THACB|nr:60S acidic ribosomal protein P2 OS=Rhodotorula glutinis PE=1 SV=1 [Rhizoctonia solani AG-1 IB]
MIIVGCKFGFILFVYRQNPQVFPKGLNLICGCRFNLNLNQHALHCCLPPPPDRAAGVDVDEDRLNKLLSELEGKDVNALISEGSSKLASVPSGGAVASGGAAPAAGAAGGAAAEEKKEEKKEEEKEESDDDMGFGLFD